MAEQAFEKEIDLLLDITRSDGKKTTSNVAEDEASQCFENISLLGQKSKLDLREAYQMSA